METALATISVLPATREEMQTFFKMAKSELLSGSVKQLLEQKVKLEILKRLAEQLLTDDDIDNAFLNEFLLYEKEKVITVLGAKLNQQETGVKYFYEEAGDPVWFDLDKQIKELTEKRKEREKFLQNLPSEGTVDPSTGVYINKPGKTSKTKVIVKI